MFCRPDVATGHYWRVVKSGYKLDADFAVKVKTWLVTEFFQKLGVDA